MCVFGRGMRNKENQVVCILLVFTQTYYLDIIKERLFTLQSEGHLMDHHGFSNQHLNKPSILCHGYLGQL